MNKLRIPATKPRNHLVALARSRKAGTHQTSRTTERQTHQRELKKALDQLC